VIQRWATDLMIGD